MPAALSDRSDTGRVKPRIALTLSRPLTSRALDSHQAYRDRLAEAGAEVLDVFSTDRVRSDFDALLMSGGGDIDPAEYGEPDDGVERGTVDAHRDRLEGEMLKAALDRGVPVLGICRGFQVLNWRFGGKLKQHVEGHRDAKPPVDPHEITASPGSLLAKICGVEPFRVNSRHHQAVLSAPEGLRPVACVGRYVEAVEAADGRWILGVQWHPETKNDPLQDEEPARRVFDAFVKAAQLVSAR
ncbi:MAG: gamma-glutamyl-gamma-aminobutyrate hydrolase family protein [Chloroflexi bacterium]|nr:gamma-glutamyl-gamma-aminobutyrate hydrolase family protein [Chloroflexota bacterium]